MTIVFRVDSSTDIGSGHLMRCLRLGSYLQARGVLVLFVVRDLPGNVSERLQNVGLPIVRLNYLPRTAVSSDLKHSHWLGVSWQVDVEETIDALRDLDPTWIIIDHYAIDWRWQKQIKQKFPPTKILVIDDIADRRHECDLLLDQNLFADPEYRYKSLIPAHCRRLFGPSHALIDPIYGSLHERALVLLSKKPAKLLVYFGAGDAGGMSLKVIRALARHLDTLALRLSIIVGKQSSDYLEILSMAQANDIEILDFIDDFPLFLSNFDIMVGAGGSTSWERAALGIPAIIYAVADNQVEFSQYLSEYGAIKYMGQAAEFSESKLTEQLFQMINDTDMFQILRKKNLQICDGRGLERVLSVMNKVQHGIH